MLRVMNAAVPACALIAALLFLIAPYGAAQGVLNTDGPPQPEEMLRYLVSDGRVIGAVVSSPDGKELRRETYVRDSEGVIVEILLRFPEGRTARTGGAEGRQWIQYPDGSRLLRVYLPDGNLESEELRNGATTISRTAYSYGPDSRRPYRMEEERPGDKWRRIVEYGPRGLAEREIVSTDSEGSETSIYRYDAQDRILEIRILAGRAERRVRYSYGEDGSETEESTDSTGALVMRVRRERDGAAIEERWDGGELFARTYRRDGRLLREEFYLGGLLVRVREAP